MADRKHIILAVLVFLGISFLGGLALAWPNYSKVIVVDREIADLKGRTNTLDERALEVARLAERMYTAQRTVREELRQIPHTPDLAELMRALSMRVDNESVIDQTFTAGSSVAAMPIEEMKAILDRRSAPDMADDVQPEPPMAMTLTIDAVATFDDVFALLTATESVNRLVRISTLRMHCERNDRNNNRHEPLLTATIGLEAIYSPR